MEQKAGNRQKEFSFSSGTSITHKNAILLGKKKSEKVKKGKEKKEKKVSWGGRSKLLKVTTGS